MPLKLIPPGKRKGNPYWIVRGSIDGQRYEVSTETRDKKDAQRFKAQLETRILSQQRCPDEPATVAEVISLYEQAKDAPSQTAFLASIHEHMGRRVLADIRDADLVEARQAIYPGRKGQTVNRQLIGVMQALVNFGAKNDLCPYHKFTKVQEEDPVQPLARLPMMERLIRASTGPGRVVLMCLAYQGWRIGETLGIERENIDFRKETIRVYVGKIKRWKSIALDGQVCRAIQRLPQREDGKVFPWRDRNNFYRDFLYPLCDKTGIYFRPHMARRGYATELLETDTSPKGIKDSNTWESVNSVLRYGQVDEAEQRRILEKRRKTGGNAGGKKKNAL